MVCLLAMEIQAEKDCVLLPAGSIDLRDFTTEQPTIERRKLTFLSSSDATL
jgi:hypothetical protein